MCVIFFCADSQPLAGGYKLILASNRDEFFARNTQTAAKWSNAEHVYGGIDLEPGREGGTWLAIGHSGGVFKVGALLNLTGEPKPRDAVAPKNILQPHNHNNSNCNAKNHHHSSTSVSDTTNTTIPSTTTKTQTHCPSSNDHFLLGRGMIVADFVAQPDDQHSILNYNQSLLKDCTKYSAFNFVSIEIGASSLPARVKLLSNVPPTLEDFENGGCYGFGNSLPHTPFEKVRHGRDEFETIVQEHGTASVETLADHLLQLLKKKHKFWPDVELKRRAPNWGEGLSSLNVHIPEHGYGSRTHTVILVDGDNKMHFIEETMAGLDPEGEWQRTHIVKDFEKDM
ncbi:transport and Golgi organization protein 2 isoform X1 [Drosophila bipectinata]|uniref:transport and Golgi organization protein 2 isoform X1 n=1 Tax=Drosophila bipectinata TaxID=42026 RepID=UPI001C8A9E7E|nr:transport and Golgi organization protein 2 isoform X1 [Drosophila bipectinata]XP_043068878.1 transport and Golgi organization protein 2 isoform X1 [Drosophila bipectinata]